MEIKNIFKNNIKLIIILGIIILLGTIGITFALVTNFNPIAVNISTNTIDADITYNNGSNSSIITTTGGEILPIADSLITEHIDNPRVIKAEFNVTGLSTNPENTIYDVALYANDENGLDCVLRSKDVKWRLYKNSSLISNGNLSPSFDTMANNRLVLTNTQQDLTQNTDKYTFIMWISESCTGDITTCDPSKDQSKYLNKQINISLKIELATKTKKTLKRITSSELSCDYEGITVPACNQLIYNSNEQTLINTSNYYTLENNKGTNAGLYKSIIKLNDGYKWTDGTTEEKTLNCNIAKKELIITTLSQNTSYNGTISTNTNNITSTGLISGHTIKKVLITPNSMSLGTNKVNASNAVIFDSNNNDVTNNYEIKYNNTGSLTVNCQNTATLPEVSNYKYNGSLLIGVTGGNYIDITGATTATQTGTYEVKVKPKANYCWSDSTTDEKTLTWHITDDVTIISLNNGVSQTNGTPEIYNKDGIFYTNSTYTKKMTTSENPIVVPVKVGHNFDGYYTEENGNGTLMIDSNGYATEALLNLVNTASLAYNETKTKVTLLSATPIDNPITSLLNLKLYANWKAKTYTITYDANGGTGAPSSQSKTHGISITIPDTIPEKYGPEFIGWSTDKNANTATYLPGDSLSVNGNITLYAIYMAPIDFEITYSNKNLIGYTSSTTELVIPELFQGDDGTWYKVTSIGSNAFFSCTGLISIIIPNSVTSIGHAAFSGCTGLTSITIPESVTSIDDQAFSGCTGLTSITIPESVTSIDYTVFNKCSNLINIEVNKNNSNYVSIDGVLYNKNITELIRLPEGKTSITIPESITSIGKYAFYKCTGLTSITIPESVTSISYYAFYGCTGLTNIIIPNGVRSIGDSAFRDCTGLTNIIIPNGVRSIGDYTFSGCTGLTSITIPNSVTSIGRYAFNGCTGLTSITIPESVTQIYYTAFHKCSNLINIEVNKNNSKYVSIDGVLYNKNITELIRLPIGKTSITIPESVTSIGYEAFYDCTGLTSITIPESVTSIGSFAFNGCTGLTNIIIPNGVRSIGNYTFYGCTGLTSITIPNSVTSIGGYAFSFCTSLTSITIPESITSIGDSAFYSTKLSNVYYTGSESSWKSISISSSGNTRLTNATIHYNYVAS